MTNISNVIVKVRDVQNTPPRFLNNLTATVAEDVPINTRVFTVRAEDGDRGNPRKIIYELVNSELY